MPTRTAGARNGGRRNEKPGSARKLGVAGDRLRRRNGSRNLNGARDRILESAIHCFAARGFSATTTREIARLAGVTEALVFYYFGRKQELYWTALEKKRRASGMIPLLQRRLQSGDPDKAILEQLANDILQVGEDRDSLLRLLLFTGLQDRSPFQTISGRFFRKHLAQSYEILTDFVRQRIRAGVYRRVDPQLAARGFFSLVGYHIIIQEFLGGKYSQRFTHKRVGEAMADLWLEGLKKR